jgi:predicted DNA-binding transcriptional regulator YafY
MIREKTDTMNQTIRRAMQDSDNLVVSMDYVDSKGVSSHRVVSPIRFLGGNRFLALCLCREEPRQFCLDRCQNVALMNAAEVMMPLAIG